MKDFLSFLKDYGVMPVVNFVGTTTIALFVLTQIPSLNFIPKVIMLYILTPFILGK